MCTENCGSVHESLLVFMWNLVVIRKKLIYWVIYIELNFNLTLNRLASVVCEFEVEIIFIQVLKVG